MSPDLLPFSECVETHLPKRRPVPKAVQPTSAMAYRELDLGAKEQAVLTALNEVPEWPTSYELFIWLYTKGRARDLNDVRPRLTNLLAKHLVVKGPKRRCTVSRKTASTWRLA